MSYRAQHIMFMQSSVDQHLGCFLLLGIVKAADMNLHTSSCLVWVLEREST